MANRQLTPEQRKRKSDLARMRRQGIEYTKKDVVTVSTDRSAKNELAILDYLADKPRTTKDISAHTGLHTANVYGYLRQLRDDGIISSDNKHWRLLPID